MAALFGDDYSAGMDLALFVEAKVNAPLLTTSRLRVVASGRGPTSPRRPPPTLAPPTAHRPPSRHAPSTRRGLLGGAPKDVGPLRHRFAADPRIRHEAPGWPEITMSTMTKSFALLAVVALLATAEASATSPGSTRCIKERLATTLLRAASHPHGPCAAAGALPLPLDTRHDAMASRRMAGRGPPTVLSRRSHSYSPRPRATVPTVRPSPPPRTTYRHLLSLGAVQKPSNASLTPQQLSLLQDHQNKEVGR